MHSERSGADRGDRRVGAGGGDEKRASVSTAKEREPGRIRGWQGGSELFGWNGSVLSKVSKCELSGGYTIGCVSGMFNGAAS